jgi:hypothetical protein
VRTCFLATLAAAALACAAIAIEPGLAAQSASSGESFTIAILRRDGVILPVAGFERDRWRNRWPLAGARVDIPISLEQAPRSWWLEQRPVATWTAWPVGADSRAVHVKGVINVTVQCARNVGLQTDYVSSQPPAPPDMQPYPKDGLATTGNVLIEPVALLDATSSDWKDALAALTPEFDARESRLRSGSRLTGAMAGESARDADLDPREHTAIPVTIEVLFRSDGAKPGTRRLYVEAVRRYGQQPASPSRAGRPGGACPALTYAGGWIEFEPGQPPRVDVKIALSDCHREGLVYTLPLGAFQAGGRRYWVVQRAAWGMERFDILEIGQTPRSEAAFTTHGGYCY